MYICQNILMKIKYLDENKIPYEYHGGNRPYSFYILLIIDDGNIRRLIIHGSAMLHLATLEIYPNCSEDVEEYLFIYY